MRTWDRGETVLLRHVWRNEVLYAFPMIVVEDKPDRVVLYLPAGTHTKNTIIDFNKGEMIGPDDHEWAGTNVLQITEANAAHSTWAMWASGTGRFLCWYVNLQLPAKRVQDGILSWDQSLDIVVRPDLSWTWKDEDHFHRIQELGWMSADEARSVRAEGQQVVRRIERKESPFDEPWPDWTPDPTWTVPDLPKDWAEIPIE